MKLHGSLYSVRTIRTLSWVIAVAVACAAVAACGRAGNVDAYLNQGNDSLNLGQYQDAITEFDQALQLQPDIAAAYIGRGVAYLQTPTLVDFRRPSPTLTVLSNCSPTIPIPTPIGV